MSLVKPFKAADLAIFDSPNDPMNIVYLFLTMLLSTGAMLLIAKFWKKRMIQGIVLAATGFTAFYEFYPLLAIVTSEEWSLFLSFAATVVLLSILVRYPKWYVMDIGGVILGVGTIAILGISLNISLTIAMLVGLAIYDAISVYKTKHMIDLADVVLHLKLPIILVIPRIKKYSLPKEKESLKAAPRRKRERHTFIMGLGDVIMPGILVASALHNIAKSGLVIALSVMLGALLGFTVLMTFVAKGKPQAGLPYLCGGAILGYLVSSYMVFGELAGLAIPM